MRKEQIDFEFDRIFKEIDNSKAKKVLLQLPDGLKPYAKYITDTIKKKFPCIEIYIWAGSNFGACDIPNVKTDLIIHFGHARFKK